MIAGPYAAFVLLVTTLMLIPGPNVALIAANSLAHGARFGLVTVAGTSAAMVVQLTLTALSLSALIGAAAELFEWLRWFGVVYLVALGAASWRRPAADLAKTTAGAGALGAIFARGFVVSLTNPKTLLFYVALFPQFVDARAPAGPQIAVLAVTFLVIALVVDSGWALLAARLRAFLAMRGRLANRLAGSLLIGAALGLALARR